MGFRKQEVCEEGWVASNVGIGHGFNFTKALKKEPPSQMCLAILPKLGGL